MNKPIKYVCKVCGFTYDPEMNDGISFLDLSEGWTCPICGIDRSEFVKIS